MNKKVLITLVGLFLLYLFVGSPAKLSAREIDSRCDVVMFSTRNCPYCAKARIFFKDLNLAWCEKDIERSADSAAIFSKIGGRGVPVTVIGDATIHGYNPDAFNRAVDKL